MIQSFQRQVIEEQMAKQKQREWRSKAGSPNATDSQKGEEAGTPNRPNLFLKNSSAHLPPRRTQLAVSQVNVEGASSLDDANSGAAGAPLQNQYQLAMGEALARHEQALMRVGELKKLQE